VCIPNDTGKAPWAFVGPMFAVWFLSDELAQRRYSFFVSDLVNLVDRYSGCRRSCVFFDILAKNPKLASSTPEVLKFCPLNATFLPSFTFLGPPIYVLLFS